MDLEAEAASAARATVLGSVFTTTIVVRCGRCGTRCREKWRARIDKVQIEKARTDHQLDSQIITDVEHQRPMLYLDRGNHCESAMGWSRLQIFLVHF